jgi:hypothetical protein
MGNEGTVSPAVLERRSAAPRSRWERFTRSPLRAALAALAGAGLMAAYAHFIGCRTGTCLLTSNVWTASIYGAAVGALVGWPGRREDRDQGRGPAPRG